MHFIIIIIFFLAQLAMIKHKLKATQEIAATGFKTGHTGGTPHEQHPQIHYIRLTACFRQEGLVRYLCQQFSTKNGSAVAAAPLTIER